MLDAARPRKALLPAMGAMKAELTANEPIARTAMITMADRISPTHEAVVATRSFVSLYKQTDVSLESRQFEFDQPIGQKGWLVCWFAGLGVLVWLAGLGWGLRDSWKEAKGPCDWQVPKTRGPDLPH